MIHTVDIQVTDSPGTRRCVLRGALDVFSASVVGTRALAGLPRDVTRLVLQLKDLDFMDSAGISALVRLRDQARARGAEVHATFGASPHFNPTVAAVLRRVLVVDDPEPAATAVS